MKITPKLKIALLTTLIIIFSLIFLVSSREKLPFDDKSLDVVPAKLSPTPEIVLPDMPIKDQKTINKLTAVFQKQYYQKIMARIAGDDKQCLPYPINSNSYSWIVENKVAYGFYMFNIGRDCNYGKKGEGYPVGGAQVYYVNTPTGWKAIDDKEGYPTVCNLIDNKYYHHELVTNLNCY